MKQLAGIALGFALTPALLGLMALFVWTSMRFELSRADVGLGYALGFAALVVFAAAGVAFARS